VYSEAFPRHGEVGRIPVPSRVSSELGKDNFRLGCRVRALAVRG
jgi:hypothetical protein